MKSVYLMGFTLTLLALSTTAANAASNGKLRFTGELVAAACSVSAGSGAASGTNPGDINVDLGKVSYEDIGTAGSGVVAAATHVNLVIDCASGATGLKGVKMRFDPASGSGIDPLAPSLLRTSGAARGVGIGILDDSNKVLNLSANESLGGSLSVTGDTATASLHLRAAYLRNSAGFVAGPANGDLPFMLTYE